MDHCVTLENWYKISVLTGTISDPKQKKTLNHNDYNDGHFLVISTELKVYSIKNWTVIYKQK